MPAVRFLPFAAYSGARNMALDEALMLSAAERGVASFRLYSWTETTLSLGYFQPASERLLNPTLAALPWVRRSTGGAAIVHDPATEFTYALALPPGPAWQPPGENWICQLHYRIREALADLGVKSKAVVCGEEQKLGPVLCFQHQTPGDLVIAGSKIAGSAQRKWKGAMLQHGSVLLRRSPSAQQLPGLNELSASALDSTEVRAALLDRLIETGWTLLQSDWTAAELADADRIERDKYASPEWNEKR